MGATNHRYGTARIVMRLLIIVVSLAAALVVYFELFGTPYMDAVSRWTASSAGATLSMLGTTVSTSGTVVGSSSFAYMVVAECTAIGPLLLFVGAVIAYPGGARAKLVGIALGLVLLPF